MNTKRGGFVQWWPFPVVLLFTACLFPLDGVVSHSLEHLKLGPDFRVELQTLQQYGQLSATIVGMTIIWLVDPLRRRRLWDWLAAVGMATVSCFALKILVGRPRPKFNDPTAFVGFWDAYPVVSSKTGGVVLKYSWDLIGRSPWDLWSMPSSHTALAVVMSVFLITLYPRLRPFGVAMVVVVGGCRVLFRDHYPTDVLVGALVGYLLAHLVIVRAWGQQIVDWVQSNAGQGAVRSEPSSLVTAPERERYAK